jgi:tetratricopeptide (TPR) repeat protein
VPVPRGGPTLQNRFDGMLSAGQFDLLLQEAGRFFASIEQGAEAADPDETAHVALRACQAACARSNWGKAVSWADRGLQAAAPGTEDGAMLHFLAGTALMYTGDLLRAERELRRFLQAVRTSSGLRRFLGDALYNLAHLMRCLGRHEHELSTFGEAAAAYMAQGRGHRVATCEYDMGWCLLLQGQIAAAVPHLSAAGQLLDAGSDPEGMVDLQTARALLHHLRQENAEAGAICQRLLGGAELPCRQRADLLWLQGLLALAEGDRRQAARLAAEACDVAAEDWWPPQMERLSAFHHKVSAGKAPVG